MIISQIESVVLWLFFVYMLFTTGAYLLLNVIAFDTLLRYMPANAMKTNESLMTGHEPPISIIVPA